MGRFLVAALPVWAIVLGIFAWLRRQEREARIGVATQLTLLRGGMLGVMAGCVPLAREGVAIWMPGTLYTAAVLCDLVDGYVARRRGEETVLGGRLDVALDALGLVVAPAGAVLLGRLPPWYLLLSAAYYLFQGSLWLRARLGWPVYGERLRPYPHARMFAGYQMGLVATVLFPVLGPPGTSVAATLFMIPTLALFGRDWLIVTGRLPPGWPGDRALATGRQLLGLTLLALRAGAAAGISLLVLRDALAPGVLALAILIAAGVVPRLSAFAAAVALAARLADRPSSLAMATYGATLLLLLAGGGRGILWSPEGRWLLSRAGAPRRREP